MRCKYAHLDPQFTVDPEWERTDARIADWWSSFEARVGALDDLFSQRSSWDLASWMHETLQAIHPRLMWEYGRGAEGRYRLVITPESEHRLRPLVDAVLARAPAVEGWEFHARRPRETHAMLAPVISARCGSDLLLTGAAVERGDFNRLDLTFARQTRFPQRTHDQALAQAFVATETLLGEECLNQWVGAIEVVKRLSQPVLLPAFAERVDGLIREVRASLPQQPYSDRIDDSKWSIFELKPDTADDYPRREDLFVVATADVDLWKAYHLDPLFASRRFSRHGEIFCYLKIDRAERLDASAFDDRGEIADAVAAALRQEGLGCTIGGGTGLRYLYVDLAIVDLERSVPLVQHALQEGGIPSRSWIRFFDAELESEWVRVRPDTPPPP